mmetsp:Transcript_459/g.1430  ORF Transcript_459/g.1430 Transcript_459/m.1430 type:complete len:91 (-) Transcript_459:547-819(-)
MGGIGRVSKRGAQRSHFVGWIVGATVEEGVGHGADHRSARGLEESVLESPFGGSASQYLRRSIASRALDSIVLFVTLRAGTPEWKRMQAS